MSALILDGKRLAQSEERALERRAEHLIARNGGIKPILATILVGEDPASATYVQMKGKACERVGIDSMKINLPTETNTRALQEEIIALNSNDAVHGILLQHPVPDHIDERACFDTIRLSKDVDGVSSAGFGLMSMDAQAFGAATPLGIVRLLRHYRIELAGKNAVVVGRSAILGKPMAMMLLKENATVTICHSHTRDLGAILNKADVIVAAVGKPQFVVGSWVRDGAIVVDAGYHRGGVGDVEIDAIAQRVAAYTPVPGGVGPMTICTLIDQTISAAELFFRKSDESVV